MDYPATDGVLGGGADAFNLHRVAGSRDDTRDQRVGRQTQLELPSRDGGTLRGSCTLTRPPNPLIVYTCSQTAPWVRSGTVPPSREPNLAGVFGTRSGKPGEACEPPDSNAIGPIPLRPSRQGGCPGLNGVWSPASLFNTITVCRAAGRLTRAWTASQRLWGWYAPDGQRLTTTTRDRPGSSSRGRRPPSGDRSGSAQHLNSQLNRQ